MKKYLLYIVPIFLLVFSCKKKPLPPEPDSGTPVFYTSCNVNGVTLRFDAGINNYYMSSSHSQDVNGVYVYKADLKQSNCTGTCSYGISFLINDIKSSVTNSKMYPDSALFLGEHPFNDGNLPPLGYYGTFSSEDTGSITGHTWSIGANPISSGTGTNYKTFNHYFPANRIYNVSSKVSNPNYTYSHTNIYKVGNPQQGNIQIDRLGSGIVYSFKALPLPIPAQSSYTWQFGDGGADEFTAEGVRNYTGVGEGTYTATLTTENLINGNICTSYYTVLAYYAEMPNPNFTNNFIPVPNSKALTAITMQVTDFNTNTVYSSSNMDQPTGNKFEIVSIEDYMPNEVGDATKKVKIKFNCKVKSGGDIIDISNGEAVIAVSYKK